MFVVEQDCPYLDLDERDLEPGTTHLWVAIDDRPVAYLRILTQPDGHLKIGRVVTSDQHRGRGLAAALMQRAVEIIGDRASVLDAQSRLEPWYEQFGYRRSGPDFLEDDILHTPMARGPLTIDTTVEG